MVDAERVVDRLPKPQRDGATAPTLTPLELIDRLAALIPLPRLHRHRYHMARRLRHSRTWSAPGSVHSMTAHCTCCFHLRLSPPIIAALGILIGVMHGLDNGAALAAAGAGAGPCALGGVAASVLILALLVASLRAAQSLVALRVVGSWIAAVGMLLIGWMLPRAA